VLVKLHKGEQRHPDFLAINPMGKVPTNPFAAAKVSSTAAKSRNRDVLRSQ